MSAAADTNAVKTTMDKENDMSDMDMTPDIYTLVDEEGNEQAFELLDVLDLDDNRGENAVSKYFSEDAYEKAAEPKELFVVPGATHVDLYDQPEYLKITLPKLDTFFKQYLK